MAEDTVIYEYTLQQAIADGVLVELFKNRWQQLSGGKPIVATAHLFQNVSLAGLLEIWNEFVQWHTHNKDEQADIFAAEMNGEKVWVIEDGQAYTLLYPDDY